MTHIVMMRPNSTTVSRPVNLPNKNLPREYQAIIANHCVLVRQCEALKEYALAEHIRQILLQEQEHRFDLAPALNESLLDDPREDRRA